jgi:hypothetical protein
MQRLYGYPANPLIPPVNPDSDKGEDKGENNPRPYGMTKNFQLESVVRSRSP